MRGVKFDISDEMLNIARKRFYGVDNVSYEILNYSSNLPEGAFDAVISSFSIHHLENEDTQRLFERIYERLPIGGLFVNYDQFCAGQPEFNNWFDSFRNKQLTVSGLTEHDIELWKNRRKLDRECSVDQETKMLTGSAFKTVKCVYSCLKFSVIAAIK